MSPASFPFLQPVRPPLCAHTLTCRSYRQHFAHKKKAARFYPDGQRTLEALPMKRLFPASNLSCRTYPVKPLRATERSNYRPALLGYAYAVPRLYGLVVSW